MAVGVRHRGHDRVRDGPLPRRRGGRRRAGHRPRAAALEAGRRLVISSDFHRAYQSLARIDGVDPLWCFAHIRRYFLRARAAHPEALGDWADAWTERIALLYRAPPPWPPPRRDAAEHAEGHGPLRSGPSTDIDAHRQLQAISACEGLLHPAAAKVIATLNNERDGLARHQDLPQLPLDNNTAERALRNPVIGRKNYYGSGARWAADLAAGTWTITATAAQNGLQPAPLPRSRDHPTACARAGASPAGADLEPFLPGHPKDAPAAPFPPAPGTAPARNPAASPHPHLPLSRALTQRRRGYCHHARDTQRGSPRVHRLLTVGQTRVRCSSRSGRASTAERLALWRRNSPGSPSHRLPPMTSATWTNRCEPDA